MTTVDPTVKFLPWFYNGTEIKPKISATNTAFKYITGSSCLKDYLGGYNHAKGKIYRRVKVQARLNFQSFKDKMVSRSSKFQLLAF